MLGGITVLETISKPNVSPWHAAWCAIIGAVFVIVFVINCVQSIKEKSYKGIFADETIGKVFALTCDILVIAAVVVGSASMWKQQDIIITKHRVTIDESVSLVEFDEKYEILKRDGDEYIIKEIDRSSE